MGRQGVNTERSYGYYITSFAIVCIIAGIFFWPMMFYPVISALDLPSIVIFITIMIITFSGCGLPDRERPHFQFHFHGEELPVMSEIREEVMNSN